MAAVRYLDFLKVIFGHVTIIEFKICICVLLLFLSKFVDAFRNQGTYWLGRWKLNILKQRLIVWYG